MYVLVEFTDEKCLAVILDKWRDGTKCALWPSWKVSSKITKAAMKKMEPQDDWQSFPIRELYEHESYDKVRKKLREAEDESDLATAFEASEDEADSYRRSKRKIRKTVFSSSDEDEDRHDFTAVSRSKITEEGSQEKVQSMPLTVSSSSPPSSISPPLSSISSPLPSTKSPSLPKPPPRIPLATTPM